MTEIQEMTLDDLDEVARIEKENFAHPWTETGFFSFLIREDALFLTAKENGELLGYCGVLTVLDEGDITNVCVKKEARRRGVASALIAALTERTGQMGVRTLHLEVRESNAAAIALYEKEGFVQDGLRRGYYEAPTEDAVLMSRTI